ncbi:MAG: hypothetical protein HY774_10305 [Acidobacteria bacterium]|nr:hypothetical protein [Acidobacteriota bacterium]
MKIIDLSQETGEVLLDMSQSYWIKGLILNTIHHRREREVPCNQTLVVSASPLVCDAQMDTGSGNGTPTVDHTLTNPNQVTRFQPNRTHRRRP